MPPMRRRPKALHDRAALGTYRGPARLTPAPKVTPYRATLLRAIDAGEVKAGTGQYRNAWRWHSAGVHVTVSRWVIEFIACGWATGGPTPALTEAGQAALDGASDG